MKRRYWLTLSWLLALLAATAVSACDDAKIEAVLAALGQGCLIDSDCDDQLVCVFRRCHYECETDKDCVELAQGPYCRLGDRPTHVCLLEGEQHCETHSDCPTAEMVCGRDKICRDGCADDSECLPGQSCLKGSCANVAEEQLPDEHPLLNDDKGGPSEPCIYNSQCLTPLACIQGLCREQCVDDRDCASNSLCVVIPDGDVPNAKACVAPTEPGGDVPAHCSDALKSGDESGVDCGGSCAPCASGGSCASGSDCASGVCTSSVCQAPTCSDSTRNGTELGVDCGGNCPNGCPAGTSCTQPSDCAAPDVCDLVQGVCEAPQCADGLLNNGESDIDCGGPNCSACDPQKKCVTPGDCTSLVCSAGTCLAAGCSDGIANGNEADVDCGGMSSGCVACGDGASCTLNDECASDKCDMLVCTAPSCTDGVQNGFELAIDCGGPTCALQNLGCPLGTPCTNDGDCDQQSPAGCHPINLTCTAKYTLTVTPSGAGSGTVASTPAGISCGSSCSMEVFNGTSIQLDATAGQNSSFNAFSGACSGASPCTVLVNGGNATVTADFGSGASGLANWHAQPSGLSSLQHAVADSAGHVLIAGGTGSGSNAGCGQLTSSGSDVVVAKYAPGAAWNAGACVASLIDGGSGTQVPGGIGIDGNDDVVVLYTVNSNFNLSGHPTKTCPGSAGFALAWYDGSLTQAATTVSECFGSNIFVFDLVVTPNGGAMVMGKFGGTEDFGGTILSSTTGRSFIASYAANGTLVAVTNFGLGNNHDFYDLKRDPITGNVLVTGICQGAVNYGNSVVSTNPGNNTSDICTALFDANLTAQWTYQAGSNGGDTGRAGAFLPNGDVLVTGEYTTTINFGDSLLQSAVGGSDIAIIHLDGASGLLKSMTPGSSWRSYGTTSNDMADDILGVLSGPDSGAIYFSGHTSSGGGIDVGGGTLTAGQGLFMAKYSSFGVHAWSTSAGSTLFGANVPRLSMTPAGAPLLVGAGGSGAPDWGTGPLSTAHVVRFNP